MVGGYVVRNLCNELPIPKDIAVRISEFAFNHHEKSEDYKGIINVSSRSSSLRKYRRDTLLHTFLALSDIAVSLREKRENRNFQSMPFNDAIKVLESELTSDLLVALFGNQTDNILNITMLIKNVISSVMMIDSAITQDKYNIEGLRVNGSEWFSTPIENAFLLESLVKKTRSKEEINSRIEKSLDNAIM